MKLLGAKRLHEQLFRSSCLASTLLIKKECESGLPFTRISHPEDLMSKELYLLPSHICPPSFLTQTIKHNEVNFFFCQ